ncbi:DNA replication/repair protein RecF [Aureispira]|nr:DNA replication/repair protein RecF [Aureispira sp.]
MYLEGLKLVNFKNYESQTLEFSPKLNCFVGDNGMGKTNLLDAIHYLCMCKSHFLIPDRFVVRHEHDFFRIEGMFSRDAKDELIVCKYKQGDRKVIERNKFQYDKLSEHVGFLPMVMVCPDDSDLITNGSEIRRKYMDVLLVQSDRLYLNHLISYNKVLKQRNAFLKNYSHPDEIDYTLLKVYDLQLIKPANYIFNKRKLILQRLKPIFQEFYNKISGSKESVDFDYFSFMHEMSLLELLQESREKDAWLRRTTKGIHKDDIKFFIDKYPVKKNASQGQLKSYLLALKLAQYQLLKEETTVNPLLLLDDIFDKLDANRVKYLLELLLTCDFGQIFITDTHDRRIIEILNNFNSGYTQFIVKDGTAKLSLQSI